MPEVKRLSVGRVLAFGLAIALVLVGGFISLAGMGYLGKSGDTSQSWSSLGSIIAGLGVALVIVAWPRRSGSGRR